MRPSLPCANRTLSAAFFGAYFQTATGVVGLG
jgi:hypothetical protein